MYIVYNTGYRTTAQLTVNGRQYFFKKSFVTEVRDEDAEEVLSKTSSDIDWCPATSKEIKPFLELEAWCKGDGRYGPKTPHEPEEYLSKFLLQVSDNRSQSI